MFLRFNEGNIKGELSLGFLMNTNICYRCTGAVFDNEQVLCNKTLLHRKCATCFLCEKKLQSNSIYQEKEEFYCDGCYR